MHIYKHEFLFVNVLWLHSDFVFNFKTHKHRNVLHLLDTKVYGHIEVHADSKAIWDFVLSGYVN